MINKKFAYLFFGIIAFLSQSLVSYSQNINGMVTYERSTYWNKIIQELPYLSNEDKARWAYQTDWNNASYTTLKFNKDADYYEQTNRTKTDPVGKEKVDTYKLYHNRTENKLIYNIETMGKRFQIMDTIAASPKWKIMHEIKDIKGYVCMKAETRDTIKNQKIVAWFTDAIPLAIGPEGYYGLPGLILELDINNGNCILEAVEINLTPEEVIAPLTIRGKNKSISYPQYKMEMANYIKDYEKINRNPYWSLRY